MSEKIASKNTLTAKELFDLNMAEVPKLLMPFYQKVGVAALVGSSDTGKSTLLRQFGLHIALKIETFLNLPIKATHNRVLYISTEDDPYTVSNAIRKQANSLKEEDPSIDLALLENFVFSFSPDKPLEVVKQHLHNKNFDLIILDAFADIFPGEINANTQVRQFLNEYDNLAKKHECLMIFLHHIGKHKDKSKPHKDNVIGSQGFEAKMRSVLELKKNKNNEKHRDLWVLKANFLGNRDKDKSFILSFNSNFIFENTENRGTGIYAKTKDPEVNKAISELFNQGLSDRAIAEKLNAGKFKISKSAVNIITKKLREAKQ